jgi:F-type H+-transporting ATPase subunit alpha
MRNQHADVIETLTSGQLTDEVIKTIEEVMSGIVAQFKA